MATLVAPRGLSLASLGGLRIVGDVLARVGLVSPGSSLGTALGAGLLLDHVIRQDNEEGLNPTIPLRLDLAQDWLQFFG